VSGLRWLPDLCWPPKLVSSFPGLLNRLEFVDDTKWNTPMGDHDVEVEVKAAALNFLDVMGALGQIPASLFGAEGAGVVTRTGPKVTKFNPGDRVVGSGLRCGNGTFQTFARFPEATAAKVPDDMGLEDAAALPVACDTVIYSLCDVARLSSGESILIHAAAGATGQAAVQIALVLGAEIFATVSTLEKKQLFMDQYAIPADHIFSSRDMSFSKGVMRMTRGQSVDVVLNSLSGEALRETWTCIADFGRFIEIGKKDSMSNGRLEMGPFLRNVSYSGVDLAPIFTNKPAKAAQLLARILQLASEKKIHLAYPLTVMNFSELEAGFRLLQSGKGMGKIVFKPHKDDLVPVSPPLHVQCCKGFADKVQDRAKDIISERIPEGRILCALGRLGWIRT
jgi:NADPH:quinone reductase-like Zn-dependent oxidoreductase